MYRLLAADMDGTLFTTDKRITAATAAAIKERAYIFGFLRPPAFGHYRRNVDIQGGYALHHL